MTTGATGNQLKLRLFLEGIEVPVIGAQVQMNLNAPATASVQVVPTDRIMDLKARTMVHLFFWDYTSDLPEAPTNFGLDNSVSNFQENLEDGEDSADSSARLDNYKLLFGGEVTGLVMSKNALGRQAVLQCADWSTYWDTSYQSMLDVGSVMGNRSAVFAGGSNVFNNLLSSHSGVMSSYLKKKPKTEGLQDVQGLMGGIISLLEVMGGVPRHTSGINDYFTIAELKNHLMQQVTAEQNDNTAQRLFSSKSFSAWLNSRSTSLGQLVSFRDMLKLLFHWVYYEVVPVTTPYYVPAVVGSRTEVIKKVRTKGTRDLNEFQILVVRSLIRKTNKYNGSLGQDLTTTNQGRVNEPKEALFIKDKLEELLRGGHETDVSTFKLPGGGERSVASEPSLLTGPLEPRAIKAVQAAIAATEGVKLVKLQRNSQVLKTRKDVDGNDVVIKAVAKEPPSLFPEWERNQKVWQRLTEALLKILGVKGRARTRKRTDIKKAKVDRLQTQIFRPDCFFVPPPRCNVLFPDQYTQFQFQRNFMQEITRLRLTTGLQFLSGKGSGFFNRSNFAPDIKSIKRIAASQNNRGLRTLLPWEKHTGILPKFEHISEINYRANQTQRKLLKNVKGQAASFGQRAANFNFIKYRFAPRTISVTGKFNPFFAPGFPALVIDKPFILDSADVNKSLHDAGVALNEPVDIGSLVSNIGPIAKFFKAPTQYLGMPAGLSHMVDQQGGVTSMTLTHARTHRITDDDFLQVWAAEVSRKKTVQVKTTVLDARELLVRGDYKGLRALIDATPQDIIDQMSRGLPQDAKPKSTGADDSITQTDDHLGRRANGAPNLAANPSLAPFLVSTSEASELLLGSSEAQLRTYLVRDIDEEEGIENGPFGGTEFIRLRGGTTTASLPGGGATIQIPSPYGPKLKPKDRGPLGGRVLEVQVLGDSVVEIKSVDMASFAGSRVQRKALKRFQKGFKSKSYFLWQKAVIHEEVNAKLVKTIPVEESLRPPWFSPLYSNLYIGSQIYQKFFGIGSIVDQSLFLTPEGDSLLSQTSERAEILAQLTAADGDPVEISRILEENEGKVLSEVPSIESAVDSLSYIYGEVRRQGLDVQRFIANYTSRPIATMRNIMGSLDLEYRRKGNILEIASGHPGFHSSAIAPYGDLLGILDNPDQALPRLRKTGKKSIISKDLDPRPERRKAVVDYAAEVSVTKGSLGAGLVG